MTTVDGEAVRREILMSSGFWFFTSTGGHRPRGAAARRVQYEAAGDPTRALRFARALVGAKIRNQRTFLRRNWRGETDPREAVMDRSHHLAEKAMHIPDRAGLLGLEGEAGALYFQAFPALLTDTTQALGTFDYTRRSRRPPADPLNACFSLCYALLTRVWANVLGSPGSTRG